MKLPLTVSLILMLFGAGVLLYCFRITKASAEDMPPINATQNVSEILSSEELSAKLGRPEPLAFPTPTTEAAAERLRQLLVLERLFEGHSDGILNPNGPDAGNLFILDQIFRDGSWFYSEDPVTAISPVNQGRLTQMFTYKKLFQGTDNFLSPGPDVTLGDVLILDALFPK